MCPFQLAGQDENKIKMKPQLTIQGLESTGAKKQERRWGIVFQCCYKKEWDISIPARIDFPVKINLPVEDHNTKWKVIVFDDHEENNVVIYAESKEMHLYQLMYAAEIGNQCILRGTSSFSDGSNVLRLRLHSSRRIRPLFNVLKNQIFHQQKTFVGMLAAAAVLISGGIVVFLATMPVSVPITLALTPILLTSLLLCVILSLICGIPLLILSPNFCELLYRISYRLPPIVQGWIYEEEEEGSSKTFSSKVHQLQYYLENVSPGEKLVLSVLLDTLGNTSFVLPGLGEVADGAWAPVSAYLLSCMYRHTVPHAAVVNFVEEILPFTDALPTATLAWYVCNHAR